MTSAFQEGVYAAGAVNPSYIGIRWNLSASHPEPDICNELAEADLYGLGKGVYKAGEEPVLPHPNCLCFATPVVKETKEFVQSLKNWLANPSSEPDIEAWYNDFYRNIQ